MKVLMILRWFIIGLAILFAIMTYAHAAPNEKAAVRLEEQKQLLAKLAELEKEKPLILREEKEAASRWHEMQRSGDTLLGLFARYWMTIESHNLATIENDLRVDVRAARCAGAQKDSELAMECDRVGREVEAEDARLEAEAKHLVALSESINATADAHKEEGQKVFEVRKASALRREALRAKVVPMLTRLKAIQAEADACVAALKSDSMDAKRDVCGWMSDGNL